MQVTVDLAIVSTAITIFCAAFGLLSSVLLGMWRHEQKITRELWHIEERLNIHLSESRSQQDFLDYRLEAIENYLEDTNGFKRKRRRSDERG